MSYYDDVIAKRKAERANRYAASDPTATNGVRFKGTGLLISGVLLCLTPLAAVGLGMVLMGLGLHIISPLLQNVEENMSVTTKQEVSEGTGNGCFAFLWACIVGAILITAVGLGAGAVAVALLHGGI